MLQKILVVTSLNNLFTMNDVNNSDIDGVKHIKVNMTVQNVTLSLEVDCGVAVSVISDNCYNKCVPNCNLPY